MHSSDLADLIQILDSDLPIVTPIHEIEPYDDPEAYMFHINDNDIDPYFLNPNPTSEEHEAKRSRKTGSSIKYYGIKDGV